MTIYFNILFLFVIFWFFSRCRGFNKFPFFEIGIIILILIASLKATCVGTDSQNYFDNFQYVESYKDDRIYSGIQRIWYYFNYVLRKITNYTLFLVVCYSIAFCGIALFIKKLSSDKMLSLLILYLFFYLGSLNIMRQYIGIGIFCIGLIFLSKNDIIKYLLTITVGAFFHYSLLLMIPLIWIRKYNAKPVINISIIGFSFLIGFVLNVMKPIVMTMSIITGLNEGSSIYLEQWGSNERNILTNCVINVVFVVSYFISSNKNDIFLKLWFFFIIMNNLFGAAGQGNRLFLYLFVGMIIAVPNLIINIQDKFLKVIYTMFYTFYGVSYWYILLSSGNGDIVPYVFR